jgi:hypothetical protein
MEEIEIEFFPNSASFKNREGQRSGYYWSSPEEIFHFSNFEEKTIVLDKFAYSQAVINELWEKSNLDEDEFIEKVKLIEQIETKMMPIDLTQTMVYVGAMGSGKTVAIETILAQDFYDRSIIHDFKGDYVEKFYEEGKDIIVSLYDERGQIWDIFEEMKSNPDISYSFVSNLMKEAVGGKTDFFLNSSIKVVSEAFIEANYNDDCKTSVEKWNKLIEIVNSYKDSVADDKTKSSILLTLELGIETFKLINYRISNGAKTFTLKEFYERKDGVKMFILNNQAYVKKLKPFNTGFLGATIDVLLGKPDNRKGEKYDYTFFLLDEWYNLKLSIESATSLLTGIRSKGGQILLGVQYLNDDKEQKQLLDSSRYGMLIFRVADGTTVKRIIEMMGKVEYEEESKSKSLADFKGSIKAPPSPFTQAYNVTTSTSIKSNNLLTEEIVQSMDEHHHITILPTKKIIYLGKTDYLNLPKKSENFELINMDDFYRNIHADIINKEKKSMIAKADVEKPKQLSDLSKKERFIVWLNVEYPKTGMSSKQYLADNGLIGIDTDELHREFSDNEEAVEKAKKLYPKEKERFDLMEDFFNLKTDGEKYDFAEKSQIVGALFSIFALQGDFIENEMEKIL